MLLCNRLSTLKHSAMVSIISATVFLASTSAPSFNFVVSVMAEEGQSVEASPAPAPESDTSSDAAGLQTMDQLVELVGPIALYPDELLAITLPAATYPLEIVQAARYLEKHKKNPDLKPDEKWDSSVLGLLNYPEVIDLMNKDLDWTWELGAAVADQQSDVMDAIQQFRNQAHTAGNLNSNEKQIIIVEKEVIKIESATPEVIYVPTYKPSTVVVVQSAPYPYYYSAPYPYYYNPHAAFWTGMFVGAAISYGVGWGRYGRYGNNDINVSRGGNTVNIGSGNTRSGGGNSRSGSRPGGGNRPGAGGGGNRPGAGGGGNRPGAGGGGNRPSAGTRPSTGQKPGAGGGGKRPSTGQRPSSGSRPSTGQRPSSGNKGSFSGQGKSGGTASRNSQRGASSRSSQSSSRSSSSRGGGGRSGASRGGGGRSGGGGRGGGGGRRR